jgi:hypothetical protein
LRYENNKKLREETANLNHRAYAAQVQLAHQSQKAEIVALKFKWNRKKYPQLDSPSLEALLSLNCSKSDIVTTLVPTPKQGKKVLTAIVQFARRGTALGIIEKFNVGDESLQLFDSIELVTTGGKPNDSESPTQGNPGLSPSGNNSKTSAAELNLPKSNLAEEADILRMMTQKQVKR